VSAIQPVTLNPESPVTFRNTCDVGNFCDDRRREVAKFTASCWVTLSAKKAVLRIILDTFFYSEHMLKKSVIAGAIGIFVSVIAVSLWVQKSSIGVLMMSLFGME
jgi:GTP-sensing pleiotropic transcriptional regulator CodY